MGARHVHTVVGSLPDAAVTAIADVDGARAHEAARSAGAASAYVDAQELISDPAVDAVLITSPAETHAELTLRSIAAGKPVFCEKPLATTADAARRVVEAEVAAGCRLVQMGFMRRFDPGYEEIKRTLDSGRVGAPLAMHCLHRTPEVGPYTSEKHTTEALVHEIDVVRWLLGEEIVRATVFTPRRTRHAAPEVSDPQVVLLHSEGGVLIDVDVFVNAQYGYDVRCEVVCEEATVALASPALVTLRHAGLESVAVPKDFRARFSVAYRRELEAWVRTLQADLAPEPSAWDGYAAATVTDASIDSLHDTAPGQVRLDAPPPLYAAATGHAADAYPALSRRVLSACKEDARGKGARGRMR